MQTVSDTKGEFQLLLYFTWVALPIDGCHKGLILHHPLNHVKAAKSGDKCNCQNNIIIGVHAFLGVCLPTLGPFHKQGLTVTRSHTEI